MEYSPSIWLRCLDRNETGRGAASHVRRSPADGEAELRRLPGHVPLENDSQISFTRRHSRGIASGPQDSWRSPLTWGTVAMAVDTETLEEAAAPCW